MTTKKKTTRGIGLRLSVSGTARFDLENIVGDKEVTPEELEALKEEATQKARDALDGCEIHGVTLDDIGFVFDLETG